MPRLRTGIIVLNSLSQSAGNHACRPETIVCQLNNICGIVFKAEYEPPHAYQHGHTGNGGHRPAQPQRNGFGTGTTADNIRTTCGHPVHGSLNPRPKIIRRRNLAVGKTLSKIFYPLLFHDTHILKADTPNSDEQATDTALAMSLTDLGLERTVLSTERPAE